jgi:hypothetical protein
MYLKRSMQLCLKAMCCGLSFGSPVGQSLLNKHLEKTVMFAEENKLNADVIKDKKSMYRNHRLSREDKRALYRLRPDLNLKSTGTEDDSSCSSAGYASDSQQSSSHQSQSGQGQGVGGGGGGGGEAASIGSSSQHSAVHLSSVMFAVDSPIKSPPRSPDARPSRKIRPDTPKAPSRGSDVDMEWDLEEGDSQTAAPAAAAEAGAEEWGASDPTEALLARAATPSGTLTISTPTAELKADPSLLIDSELFGWLIFCLLFSFNVTKRLLGPLHPRRRR